jgi:hypothetical protein
VAHTAAREVLLDDQEMLEWICVSLEDFFLASANIVDSLVKYHNSVELFKSGFSLAHAPGAPMFAVFGKGNARARRIGMTMASLTGEKATNLVTCLMGIHGEKLAKMSLLMYATHFFSIL